MFQVAELVTSEFFEQGDRERSELKLTPSVSSFFYYDVSTLLSDFFLKNDSKPHEKGEIKNRFKEALLKV